MQAYEVLLQKLKWLLPMLCVGQEELAMWLACVSVIVWEPQISFHKKYIYLIVHNNNNINNLECILQQFYNPDHETFTLQNRFNNLLFCWLVDISVRCTTN